MLFSYFGEFGLVLVGLLYVLDKWFDSYIDMMELTKNKDDEKEPMPEAAKRMYS